MDTAERANVRRALDELKPHLAAYVTQHVTSTATLERGASGRGNDVQSLLRSMLDAWDLVFRRHLPAVARSYVHELIDIRNRWAHEEPFSRAEAKRACDTAQQLAALIGAPELGTAPRARRDKGRRSDPSAPRRSQRDVMRAIFHVHGHDADRVVREYAAAERRGEVARKSNQADISAEDYARALLNDGERKGWLHDRGA